MRIGVVYARLYIEWLWRGKTGQGRAGEGVDLGGVLHIFEVGEPTGVTYHATEHAS